MIKPAPVDASHDLLRVSPVVLLDIHIKFTLPPLKHEYTNEAPTGRVRKSAASKGLGLK